jgi:hypothetical protein
LAGDGVPGAAVLEETDAGGVTAGDVGAAFELDEGAEGVTGDLAEEATLGAG